MIETNRIIFDKSRLLEGFAGVSRSEAFFFFKKAQNKTYFLHQYTDMNDRNRNPQSQSHIYVILITFDESTHCFKLLSFRRKVKG